MNSLNRTLISRPPARPQGAGKPPAKVEAVHRSASRPSPGGRSETETERIAVLGYN